MSEFDDLESYGFSQHIRYPGPVHQWLSPNDNRLHGAANQVWRKSRIDFKDDALAIISLLAAMDEQTKSVDTWFHKNLQVDSLSLSKEKVADLIRGEKHSYNKTYVQARWDYLFATGQDPRGDYTDRLPDGLDSRYYV